MAIGPLGASVCSLISQLPTRRSPLRQRFWPSPQFNVPVFCETAETAATTSKATINTLPPKNLYMDSVSLNHLGFAFFLFSRGSVGQTPLSWSLWQESSTTKTPWDAVSTVTR